MKNEPLNQIPKIFHMNRVLCNNETNIVHYLEMNKLFYYLVMNRGLLFGNGYSDYVDVHQLCTDFM